MVRRLKTIRRDNESDIQYLTHMVYNDSVRLHTLFNYIQK